MGFRGFGSFAIGAMVGGIVASQLARRSYRGSYPYSSMPSGNASYSARRYKTPKPDNTVMDVAPVEQQPQAATNNPITAELLNAAREGSDAGTVEQRTTFKQALLGQLMSASIVSGKFLIKTPDGQDISFPMDKTRDFFNYCLNNPEATLGNTGIKVPNPEAYFQSAAMPYIRDTSLKMDGREIEDVIGYGKRRPIGSDAVDYNPAFAAAMDGSASLPGMRDEIAKYDQLAQLSTARAQNSAKFRPT